MIFSQYCRQDLSAKLSGESSFAFLDRSARVEIQSVRDKLESIILEYPNEEMFELISRLRSGNDQHFNSAFFELLLYCGLTRLGYGLQPHPVLANGSSKRPDFLVTAPNGTRFYLEAVLASEENGNLQGPQRMVQTTLDAIRKTRHEKFWVDVRHSGLPTTQPGTKKLISDILAWLDKLDPDNVRRQMREGGVMKYQFTWNHEGLHLHLTPRPINRVRSKSLIGMTSRGMTFSNSAIPLRDAIAFKGNRYGELEFPLLIAVNFNTPFLDSEEEVEALFGSPLLQHTEEAHSSPEIGLTKEGVWRSRGRPKYTRISGAWIFNALCPYSLARRRSTLYFNPWASKQLPVDLKRLPHVELSDEGLTYHKGITFREIFELSEEWPNESK